MSQLASIEDQNQAYAANSRPFVAQKNNQRTNAMLINDPSLPHSSRLVETSSQAVYPPQNAAVAQGSPMRRALDDYLIQHSLDNSSKMSQQMQPRYLYPQQQQVQYHGGAPPMSLTAREVDSGGLTLSQIQSARQQSSPQSRRFKSRDSPPIKQMRRKRSIENALTQQIKDSELSIPLKMTLCAKRRCCSLRRGQVTQAMIEQASQMEAQQTARLCRCNSQVSFTKSHRSLNSYEGSAPKHNRSVSVSDVANSQNCCCCLTMRRSISQKSFPAQRGSERADFSFRGKRNLKSLDTKSSCSIRKHRISTEKSLSRVKTNSVQRMLEYSNNLALAKSQLQQQRVRGKTKSSQKKKSKKQTPLQVKSYRTFSGSKSSSKSGRASKLSLGSDKRRHRRTSTSRFSAKEKRSTGGTGEKKKQRSSMKKSAGSTMRKKRSVDFNNNQQAEFEKSMDHKQQIYGGQSQAYFSQDLYPKPKNMMRSNTAKIPFSTTEQEMEPVSDHYASFAVPDICASKSGSGTNTKQNTQKLGASVEIQQQLTPKEYMQSKHFLNQQTTPPSANELKSFRKWHQALDKLGSLHGDRLVRLRKRAEVLIKGSMTTNEIVKVLVAHPDTQEFGHQRVDELVSAGLNVDQEIEIDRLQRHLIEMQARVETAEEKAEAADEEADQLRTRLTQIRALNPNVIEGERLDPIMLSASGTKTQYGDQFSALRKDLEHTGKSQRIMQREQMENSRQRELNLKTDLVDIQAREINDVKENTKAKYREKMIRFEKECSESLRSKLGQAENSLREKYESELSELKSVMVEIKDHEDIVNKQLDNLRDRHKIELKQIMTERDLVSDELAKYKLEYSNLQNAVAVQENRFQSQILQKDHEIRNLVDSKKSDGAASEEKLYNQLRKVIEEKANAEKESFEANLTLQTRIEKSDNREQQLVNEFNQLEMQLTAEREKTAVLEANQDNIEAKAELFLQKEIQKHQKQLQKYVWALTQAMSKVNDLRNNLDLLKAQTHGEIGLVQETVRQNCELLINLIRRREMDYARTTSELAKASGAIKHTEEANAEIQRQNSTMEALQRELNEKVLAAACSSGKHEQEVTMLADNLDTEKTKNSQLEEQNQKLLKSEQEMLSTSASLQEQVQSLHKESESKQASSQKELKHMRNQVESFTSTISRISQEKDQTMNHLAEAQYIIDHHRAKNQKKRDASAKKRKNLARAERALGESLAKAQSTLHRTQYDSNSGISDMYQAPAAAQYFTNKFSQSVKSGLDLRASSNSVTPGFLVASQQLLQQSRGCPNTQEYRGSRRTRSPLVQQAQPINESTNLRAWSREQKENLKLSRQHSNFLQRRAAGLIFEA